MTGISHEIIAQLTPTGELRAAINMSNFLLVVGKTDSGEPLGLSPDLAKAIADALGVPIRFIPFKTPKEISDSAGKGLWDIGNIGAEPQRTKRMDFTAPYVEIESTYLVPAGSTIQSIDEVDQPGKRISFAAGSAYGLWLENNIKSADLRPTGIKQAFNQFADEKMDAYAGLLPHLLTLVKELPGARVLDGKFASVQQAVGVNKGNPEALAWLSQFVDEAKASGLISSLIEKHGVQEKLSIAP